MVGGGPTHDPVKGARTEGEALDALIEKIRRKYVSTITDSDRR